MANRISDYKPSKIAHALVLARLQISILTTSHGTRETPSAACVDACAIGVTPREPQRVTACRVVCDSHAVGLARRETRAVVCMIIIAAVQLLSWT